MARPVICAVDFDGTICEHEFPDIGEEIPGAIDALKYFQAIGCKLILWTCRSGKELVGAVNWCAERGVEFDAVNENIEGINYGYPKIVATVYIDDHSLEHMRWGGGDFTAEKWQEAKEAVTRLVAERSRGIMTNEGYKRASST